MPDSPDSPEKPVRKIQILGTGCAKCHQLAANAEAAAQALGLDYELVQVTDINDILAFGVMMTPALAVDGEVRLVGKVPDARAIQDLLA